MEINRHNIFKGLIASLDVKPLATLASDTLDVTNISSAPIKETISDISNYDIIYVGSPVFWGGMPEELFTALKGLNFSGKIVRPFVTHEGSGLSSIPKQLAEICIGAQITPGLAIIGSQAKESKDKVKAWL